MKNKGYFKKANGKWRLSLLGREALAGIGFALPFLIGFFGLFLVATGGHKKEKAKEETTF